MANDHLPAEGLDVEALAERLADRILDRLATQTQQRYLTVTHAAAYCDVSEDTIRSLLAGRKLTALRPVAGRIVIDRRELDAYVLNSTKGPRSGRGMRPVEGR